MTFTCDDVDAQSYHVVTDPQPCGGADCAHLDISPLVSPTWRCGVCGVHVCSWCLVHARPTHRCQPHDRAA